MSPHEIACATALRSVTFLPATPQKRFAREMGWLAENAPTRDLTPKQSRWLSALVWTFRRQIKNKYLVAACAIRTTCATRGNPEIDGMIERREQQMGKAPGRVDVPEYGDEPERPA